MFMKSCIYLLRLQIDKANNAFTSNLLERPSESSVSFPSLELLFSLSLSISESDSI